MTEVRYNSSTTELHVDDEIFYKPRSDRLRKLLILLVVALCVAVAVLVYLFVDTRNNLVVVKNKYDKLSGGTITQAPPPVPTEAKTTAKPAETTVVPTTKGDEPYLHYRLPLDIVPSHYDVHLKSDLVTDEVTGSVDIKVEVKTPTSYVIVHAHKYDSIVPKVYKGSEELSQKREFVYKKNQYHVTELKEPLQKGNYTLKYKFTYKLRDTLKGFYKATYRDEKGTVRKLASTQFEPVDARTAFVCFDEPALKATFIITIEHRDKYFSIGNTPTESKKTTDGWITHTFKITPVMSTYLIAFVVCDFAKYTVITETKKKTKMDFYAPKHQINQLNFSMNVGAKVLPYFEKFYNLTYPLAKADQIAIPDFSAGAMENWGLVTYRAQSLLFDEDKSALSNAKRIASTVSHELAHQWFGNIVTMEWWSDLWLNEGFATFVAAIGVDYVYPKWKVQNKEVLSRRSVAMRLDALVTSHPIFVEVKHPDEINEIFDSISYSKGALILRMLQDVLGEDDFKKGLSQYLNEHAFGNAKTNDLWLALGKATNNRHNVSAIMNTWTLQMGFPVVMVTNKDNVTIDLSQKRFYADINPDLSKTNYTSPYNYKWIVPFNYELINKTGDNEWKRVERSRVWMNKSSATVAGCKTCFIKGNSLQDGFYRVNYDNQTWMKLAEILKNNHSFFDVKDRVGIVTDAFALADANELSYETALDVLDYIDNDEDYLPWGALVDSLSKMRGLIIKTSKAHKLMKKFLFTKVSGLYKKYGFNTSFTEHNDRLLQVLVIKLACGSGNEDCLNKASQLFSEWMNDENKQIPADFRTTVYFYGVNRGGLNEWKFAYEQYMKTHVATDKVKLIYGMAAAQEPWIINRYLHMALNQSIVKDQDFSYVISYVARSSSANRHFTFSFMKENWDILAKRFAKSLSTLGRIFKSVCSGFSTEYELEALEKFVAKIPDQGTAARTIKQTMEGIRANIEWRKRYEATIENLLEKRV